MASNITNSPSLSNLHDIYDLYSAQFNNSIQPLIPLVVHLGLAD